MTDSRRTAAAPLRHALARWAPAVAWMAVIFALSAQPGLRVAEDDVLDFVLRKIAHIGVFAVLAVLITWALDGVGGAGGKRHRRTAFAIAVLYAVSDELHQVSVGGRAGSVLDVVIDAGGAALGAFGAWPLAQRLGRRSRRQPDPQ